MVKDYISNRKHYLTDEEYYEYVEGKKYCLSYDCYKPVPIEGIGLLEDFERFPYLVELFRKAMRREYLHNIYGELHRVAY